ncbi:hypothetical protein B0T20DRAFT_244930 [Sordaria brevicollis]|uniref:Uncharacterized protein n=1 Tax=Sordaria brevicollis TaxID=83679 RepID=A0AAE0UAY6_SORBR|nr:hypothetical protein B0T20DRAFT_244930 [Sordaria brevicollis]
MCLYERWVWVCGYVLLRYPQNDDGDIIEPRCRNLNESKFPNNCPDRECVGTLTFDEHCYRCQVGRIVPKWVCSHCSHVNDADSDVCQRNWSTVEYKGNPIPMHRRNGDNIRSRVDIASTPPCPYRQKADVSSLLPSKGYLVGFQDGVCKCHQTTGKETKVSWKSPCHLLDAGT